MLGDDGDGGCAVMFAEGKSGREANDTGAQDEEGGFAGG